MESVGIALSQATQSLNSFWQSVPAEYHMIAFTLLIIACILVSLSLIAKGIKSFVYFIRLSSIDNRYPGIRAYIPKNCRIRKIPRDTTVLYTLQFPTWDHPTNNGTRDHRYKQNYVIWRTCTIPVDQYELTCKNPIAAANLVAELRARGVAIQPCREEIDKGNYLVAEARRMRDLDSIESIVNFFAEKPAEFEEYCANLFRHLGYSAWTTPATNDGGYDIELYGSNGHGIAECKCFTPSNKVGRPALQKLVGANQVIGANRLVFITTSSFSKEALDYADQTGVECINGTQLLGLQNTAFGTDSQHINFNSVNWQLTPDDIVLYYPPDLR